MACSCVRHIHQRVDAITACTNIGKRLNKALKLIIAGNKICFGVYLNNSTNIAIGFHSHQTFACHTASFFGGGGQTFFPQPVNSRFHITTCFIKGFFAIHHSSTGRCAELFYHLRSNRHYSILSIRLYRKYMLLEPLPNMAGINNQARGLTWRLLR